MPVGICPLLMPRASRNRRHCQRALSERDPLQSGDGTAFSALRDSAGDRQKGHHQLSIRFCYVLLIDPLISVGLNDRRLRAVAGPAAKAPVKS